MSRSTAIQELVNRQRSAHPNASFDACYAWAIQEVNKINGRNPFAGEAAVSDSEILAAVRLARRQVLDRGMV
jgi:hypothetical protein